MTSCHMHFYVIFYKFSLVLSQNVRLLEKINRMTSKNRRNTDSGIRSRLSNLHAFYKSPDTHSRGSKRRSCFLAARIKRGSKEAGRCRRC